ncbi:MAG: hypothetical protein ACI4TD_08555, partial [Phocaeicola sp.]
LTGADTWPYLPKGDYLIKGTATQNRSEVNLGELKFTVNAPSFTVNTPSAHTNYDTYTNSGADAANAEDGSTIFGVTHNGVKISDNILSNDKYSSLIGGYTYFIDGVKASAGDHSGQTWAAHAVTAQFTFDGTTAESSPLTCHVTGLPYLKDINKSFSNEWTSSGTVSWEADHIRLGQNSFSSSASISKQFYIPAKTYIFLYSKFDIRRGTKDNSFNIAIDSNTPINEKNTSYNSTKNYNFENVISEISTGEVVCTNTYSVGAAWTDLYFLHIKYRDKN